jgi:hypothetical protein
MVFHNRLEFEMSIRKCISDEGFLFLVIDQDGILMAAFKHREDALKFIGK